MGDVGSLAVLARDSDGVVLRYRRDERRRLASRRGEHAGGAIRPKEESRSEHIEPLKTGKPWVRLIKRDYRILFGTYDDARRVVLVRNRKASI